MKDAIFFVNSIMYSKTLVSVVVALAAGVFIGWVTRGPSGQESHGVAASNADSSKRGLPYGVDRSISNQSLLLEERNQYERYKATYDAQFDRALKTSALKSKKRLAESEELENLLGLSASQIEALRDICEIEKEVHFAYLQETLGMLTRDERVARVKELEFTSFQDALMPILDSDQKAIYEDYLEVEQNELIEQQVTSAVNSLPKDAGITEEQREKLYNALFVARKTRYSSKGWYPTYDPAFKDLNTHAGDKADLTVMSKFLTEEQLLIVIERRLQKRVRLENGHWVIIGRD